MHKFSQNQTDYEIKLINKAALAKQFLYIILC
ncbi:MAG: hypothetical protein RLY58_916 [Pseudomonadota bacterium]|jgi:hypothetical protein